VIPQVTVGLPVNVLGVAGTFAMVSDFAFEEQKAVFALTVTAPLLKLASAMATLMLFVVEAPVKPDGSVQVYERAPDTGLAVYVPEVRVQIMVGPVSVDGMEGIALTVTTDAVDVAEQPAAELTVTVYDPAALAE
jgi:hypothetical protein